MKKTLKLVCSTLVIGLCMTAGIFAFADNANNNELRSPSSKFGLKFQSNQDNYSQKSVDLLMGILSE